MSTKPTAINNQGTIAGCYSDSSFVFHGFLLSPSGTLTTIDEPDTPLGFGSGTCISALNSTGDVAGTYVVSFNQWGGFIRTSSGQFTSLLASGNIPAGTYSVVPTSIDDAGDAAGYFLNIFSQNHLSYPFMASKNGQPIPLAFEFGVFGYEPSGQVHFLSGTGDAVGSYSPSNVLIGFVKQSDNNYEFVQAPTNSGLNLLGTDPQCINSTGWIVGSVFYIGASRSFLRASDGTFTIFDPPGTGTYSAAQFINASGVIAGNFEDANSGQHGYLRNTDGTFIIIDDPNALPSGSTRINGFNDLGQVVGTYSDAQGYTHGFIRK